MVWLTTAFSMSMLKEGHWTIHISPMPEDRIKEMPNLKSGIGHPATAKILSKRLNKTLNAERVFLRFDENFDLIVAQIETGQRLKEGQILSEEEVAKLPIKYWLVEARINR